MKEKLATVCGLRVDGPRLLRPVENQRPEVREFVARMFRQRRELKCEDPEANC
ncbi:MAG: hypothetical protein HIU85_01270 [Proteobacteria bacterium]|nr:hypothetical protein [Pseudomonadota bacterium]